jgi:undecaprenyl-phosphate 4-deoxy-4-formamido-L-arabinose transferase
MSKKINTKDSITIIIPIYNSSKSIVELEKRISNSLKGYDYELILIDDFSKDNSLDIIKKLNNSSITAIKLDKNYGQQNAIKCGLDFSTKNYIITMDDDLQHCPEDILLLVNECKKYDVVYGIYSSKKHNHLRNYGSKLVNYIFNSVLGKPHNIRISSFRCMNRKLVDKLKKDKTSFVYLSAMIIEQTSNISNVQVNHSCRKYGNSNYNFYKLIKLVIKLYVYYGNNKLFKKIRKKDKQYEIKEIWRME